MKSKSEFERNQMNFEEIQKEYYLLNPAEKNINSKKY